MKKELVMTNPDESALANLQDQSIDLYCRLGEVIEQWGEGFESASANAVFRALLMTEIDWLKSVPEEARGMITNQVMRERFTAMMGAGLLAPSADGPKPEGEA